MGLFYGDPLHIGLYSTINHPLSDSDHVVHGNEVRPVCKKFDNRRNNLLKKILPIVTFHFKLSLNMRTDVIFGSIQTTKRCC